MRSPVLVLLCLVIISCSDKRPAAVVTKAESTTESITGEAPSGTTQALSNAADFAALDQYLKQFARPTQQFVVGADSNSIIVGAKGSRISVVPGDLELSDGTKPSGKITVELIELQTQEDLVRHGVATTSDGKLLESGGSYYIQMRSGTRPLRLKSGRSLAAMFPKKSPREMQLFYGVNDAAGDVNWTLSKEVFVPYDAARSARSSALAEGVSSARGGNPTTGTAGDSTMLSYEVPRYKDTILAAMEVRPDHPQTKITPEMRKLYAPVDIKFINGSYYVVGKVRDTVNRMYAQRKVAGINKLIGEYYEVMRLSKLGWANIDRFRNEQLIAMQATAPTGNTLRAIEAFFVYKDMNTVVRKRLNLDESGSIPLENIAEGKNVKIIALGWQDGAAYAHAQTVRTSHNKQIRLDLKRVTKEELERMMVM